MLYAKMLSIIDDVNSQVTEREELVEAIAIALLTRKNLFILGEPGQAKSFVINEFRRRITGAKQFERLLSKQADEEQLFGRIDLSTLIPGNADEDILANDSDYQFCLDALRKQKQNDPGDLDGLEIYLRKLEVYKKTAYALHGNKPKLITAGKIPDCHIAFLDEIFKANDGILNSLLTAMNERRFTNEGNTTDIPVISFFAASNEIPNFNDASEKILKALYDRLELKLVTEYVKDKNNRLTVLKNKQTGVNGQIQNTVTLDELYAMQAEVSAVAVSDEINGLMDDILCELREKKIHISDRKYFGYYSLAQAYAWLKGRRCVETSDLLILRHYLWTSPDERVTITELLERKCINPLKDALDDILKMGVEAYAEFEGTAANSNTALRIGKFRREYLTLFETIVNLRAKSQSRSETDQINDTLSQLEEYSKKAHTSVNYTYAPLNEQYELQKTA